MLPVIHVSIVEVQRCEAKMKYLLYCNMQLSCVLLSVLKPHVHELETGESDSRLN